MIQEYEKQGAICRVPEQPDALTRSEFYEFLTGAFGLDAAAAKSKTVLLAELGRCWSVDAPPVS